VYPLPTGEVWGASPRKFDFLGAKLWNLRHFITHIRQNSEVLIKAFFHCTWVSESGKSSSQILWLESWLLTKTLIITPLFLERQPMATWPSTSCLWNFKPNLCIICKKCTNCNKHNQIFMLGSKIYCFMGRVTAACQVVGHHCLLYNGRACQLIFYFGAKIFFQQKMEPRYFFQTNPAPPPSIKWSLP